MEIKSLLAFFYISKLGYCDRGLIDYKPVYIGNYVWIGHTGVILPGVSVVADGEIIGAGAVVHENVPPYAIAPGCPARVVR